MARAQTVIVSWCSAILVVFAVVTIANMEPSLLAPSGYPPVRDIFASVALTFFAFLGFGIVTFTAKDLAEPSTAAARRPCIWRSGIATVIYVAVSLGVFGTLTVAKVIASGGTAHGRGRRAHARAGRLLADERHRAVRHRRGDQRRACTRPRDCASTSPRSGQFPPFMGRYLGGRASIGLLITGGRRHRARARLRPDRDRLHRQRGGPADLPAHHDRAPARSVRDRRPDVDPRSWASLTTGLAFLTFVFTTLVDEPASVATLVAILVFSVVFDLWWKARRDTGSPREAEA